jgi:hypothetical protein
VYLDGRRSHDNVGIVNWWWTFVDNGDQNISGSYEKYKFNVTGRYAITLTVCDAAGNCDSDSATAIIAYASDPIDPMANAGGNRAIIQKGTVKCSGGYPNVVYPGQLMLDGSLSNGTGSSIIRYEWTITDPLGGVTNYSGVTANHTFTIAGAHSVKLEVWDEGLNYGSTTVTINVIPFDSNADGLPDDWETRYFGSITKYKGNEDPDHDGYNNVEELCRNSDPTIPDVANQPTTFASEYWWLFLVIALIVLIVVVGIFYSRRPRLLEPEEAPVVAPAKAPLTPFGLAPAVAEEPLESEKVADKEEEELKEIIDGKWDKPKEDELS